MSASRRALRVFRMVTMRGVSFERRALGRVGKNLVVRLAAQPWRPQWERLQNELSSHAQFNRGDQAGSDPAPG
jgi:hypothetical protein